jgi:hypothetical protein
MESAMEQNQSSGATEELGGKGQEGIGWAGRDSGTQSRGAMAGEGADTVRNFSGSVEDSLRHYIEDKPYTTAAIALAVGWLIGRSHRPF